MLVATPIDLGRLMKIDKPAVQRTCATSSRSTTRQRRSVKKRPPTRCSRPSAHRGEHQATLPGIFGIRPHDLERSLRLGLDPDLGLALHLHEALFRFRVLGNDRQAQLVDAECRLAARCQIREGAVRGPRVRHADPVGFGPADVAT